MTPVVCSRSFSQNEKELKFVTIPQDYIQYIDTDDYRCFLDQCDEVLKKQKKQAISKLCMIEMWMVCRCFCKYFDMVVKPTNAQLTEEEKDAYHYKADCNSFLEEYHKCFLSEFPLEAKVLNSVDKPNASSSRLDFVMRKEYQFLKNILSHEEIKMSRHLLFFFF